MNHTFLGHLMEARARQSGPVKIAVMGAGWYGSGTIRDIAKWPGMETRVIFEKNTEKAGDLFVSTGVPREDVVFTEDLQELKEALENNKYIVSSNIDLIGNLSGMDLFFDATGNVLAGTKAALACIANKLHFITASAELDVTIGYTLCQRAKDAGIIYSNADGDQPGCLARLYDDVKMFGLKPVAAVNGKGFLRCHQTPDDVREYCVGDLNANKITSFADGTKQGIELAVVSNALDFEPARRGMYGISTRAKTLLADIMKTVNKEGFVDYYFGNKEEGLGMTVCIIARCDDEHLKRDLKYLSMGEGPYYKFYREYHLCYFETARGMAEAILLNKPLIQPNCLKADVITAAKKDLKKGESLGHIGGYNYYGLIDTYETMINGNFLPVGLAEYAVLKDQAAIDTPITYDMVTFPEDNIVLQLRKEQDEVFKINMLSSEK